MNITHIRIDLVVILELSALVSQGYAGPKSVVETASTQNVSLGVTRTHAGPKAVVETGSTQNVSNHHTQGSALNISLDYKCIVG